MFSVAKKIGWKRWAKISVDRLLCRIGMRPRQAYALNPMRGYPRNLPCWCGSPVKAKRCCLPKQGKLMLASDAVVAAEYMKHVNHAMKEG